MSNNLNAAYADAWFSADMAVNKRDIERKKDQLDDEYSLAYDELYGGTELAGERRSESGTIGGAVGCGVGIVASIFGYGDPVTNCSTGYKLGSGTGKMTYDWGWYDDLESEIEDMEDDLEDFDFELGRIGDKYYSMDSEEWERRRTATQDSHLDELNNWQESFYNNWMEDILYDMGPAAIDIVKTYGMKEVGDYLMSGFNKGIDFSPAPAGFESTITSQKSDMFNYPQEVGRIQ